MIEKGTHRSQMTGQNTLTSVMPRTFSWTASKKNIHRSASPNCIVKKRLQLISYVITALSTCHHHLILNVTRIAKSTALTSERSEKSRPGPVSPPREFHPWLPTYTISIHPKKKHLNDKRSKTSLYRHAIQIGSCTLLNCNPLDLSLKTSRLIF